MALNKATLKAELLSIYNDAKTTPMTEDTFADRVSTAIDNYIKTAIVNTGITLTTPDTINGTTTGTGTLS